MVATFILTKSLICNVVGNDNVDIPPEVIEGWNSLAEEMGTFHYLIETSVSDGPNKFKPQIIARLNNLYEKIERLPTQFNRDDPHGSVESVALFDGHEFFSIGRTKDGKFVLGKVGNDSGIATSIAPASRRSPSVFGVNFLEAIDSSTKFNVTHYSSDSSTVTFTALDRTPHEPEQVTVVLDPSANYRPVSAIADYGNSGLYRQTASMKYGTHPALAEKIVTKTFQSQDQNNGTW